MMSILYIDGDQKAHTILSQALPRYSFRTAATADEARALLEQERFAAILMDVHLPGKSGLSFLEELSGKITLPPVVMLSAQGSPEHVVRAMRAGAIDFIPKPYTLEQIQKALLRAVGHQSVIEAAAAGYEAAEVHEEPAGALPGPRFIGTSPEARHVRTILRLYAESDAPVLLLGESGSGKEVAAHEVHTLSGRSGGPFVPLNCGAIPSSLIEAELYGTAEGIYTGAVNRHGYFEQANGGTLFLDEVGEMPLPSQVKLLRIIENQRFSRLGDRRLVHVDVRVIAATNRSLVEQMASKRFRSDLYHRLNVLSLYIPPLRDRKEDIPDLIRHFLRCFGAGEIGIDNAALMKLIDYDWPGNVRELKNAIERALVFSRRHTIKSHHIILGLDAFPRI